MSLLTSNSQSLNPSSDYLYGTLGRRVFLQDLQFICAQAVAQTYPEHPMYEPVMREATRSRARIQRDLDARKAAEQRAIKAA